MTCCTGRPNSGGALLVRLVRMVHQMPGPALGLDGVVAGMGGGRCSAQRMYEVPFNGQLFRRDFEIDILETNGRCTLYLISCLLYYTASR